MVALYIAIGYLLGQVNQIALIIYGSFFVLVAVGQSFACVYLRCPYVGKFGPCVGGFCQIARLFRQKAPSRAVFDVAVTIAFLALIGIILLPIPFIYQVHILLALAYLVLVLVYTAAFLGFICPACAIKHACPGGQASTALHRLLNIETG
jgi:hypothetical protein